MKRTISALAIPVMFFGMAAYADEMVDAGKAAFEARCAECHYEDDFAGETKADMMAMIGGVVSGEIDHKGDLSNLTDGEKAKLAAFFSSFK